MAKHRPNLATLCLVGVREFRENLTAFLDQIREGHCFVLTSHDKIVAEIGPPSSCGAVRKPGALRGKIKVSQDFHAHQSDMQPAEEEA